MIRKSLPRTRSGWVPVFGKIMLQKIMLQKYELVPAGWIEQPTFAL
jgi:hypothetical protein